MAFENENYLHGMENDEMSECCKESTNESGKAVLNDPPDTRDETVLLGEKLAPYNPTNIDCVHLALRMMHITDSDVLYDLGTICVDNIVHFVTFGI